MTQEDLEPPFELHVVEVPRKDTDARDHLVAWFCTIGAVTIVAPPLGVLFLILTIWVMILRKWNPPQNTEPVVMKKTMVMTSRKPKE